MDRIVIDWVSSVRIWIDAVEENVIPIIANDKRLINGNELITRFRDSVSRWNLENKSRVGAAINTRRLSEDVNEVVVAKCILSRMEADERLDYEPKLSKTGKSIDFRVIDNSQIIHWLDVKTVNPKWNDSEEKWERYRHLSESFPDNSKLLVEKDWHGAAISNELINSRYSFVGNSKKLEEKISLLSQSEHGQYYLILCNNGGWSISDLEDFSYYYRTGEFSESDWCRCIIEQHMKEKEIEFNRSITNFSYMERAFDAHVETRFIINVKHPGKCD